MPERDLTLEEIEEALGLTSGNGQTPGWENDFWTARPELEHIRQFAYARMVSPWAMLGWTLTSVIYYIPPWVRLPPIIGDDASLNLFCAIVAPSGVGKSVSYGAARAAFKLHPEPIHKAQAGSGEGIVKQYVHYDTQEKKQVWDRDAVLFTASEVDTLAALKNRTGSTLIGTVRMAYSGEALGFAYADNHRKLQIPEHAYRLCFVIGVQPERADALLEGAEAAGGTPQRFIWLPAGDPHISADVPPTPEPLKITRLQHLRHTNEQTYNGWTVPVCAEAEREIRVNHAMRATGQGEPLDGHALQTQEKVAVALAALADREQLEVTFDDWELARMVMRKSDKTRAMVQAALTRKREREGTARAMEDGRREHIKGEVTADMAVQKACQAVLRILTREWTNQSEVHRRARRHREHIDEAVDLLVAAGQIEVEEFIYNNQSGRRMRLAN